MVHKCRTVANKPQWKRWRKQSLYWLGRKRSEKFCRTSPDVKSKVSPIVILHMIVITFLVGDEEESIEERNGMSNEQGNEMGRLDMRK